MEAVVEYTRFSVSGFPTKNNNQDCDKQNSKYYFKEGLGASWCSTHLPSKQKIPSWIPRGGTNPPGAALGRASSVKIC